MPQANPPANSAPVHVNPLTQGGVNRNDSGRSAITVVPSDTISIPATRGLYLGVAGDVVCKLLEGGNLVTFKNLAVGVVHPLSVVHIMATGTSATDMLAIY